MKSVCGTSGCGQRRYRVIVLSTFGATIGLRKYSRSGARVARNISAERPQCRSS